MQPANTEAILARLDTQRACVPRPLLASDADGTLWDGDIGFDLFETLLAARAVRAPAREGLAAEARALGLSDGGDASALAAALYAVYKDGRYAHDRAFAMMAWVFAGYSRDELAAFCARVLQACRIEARIRPELHVIVDWAARHGVDVFVVSASPRAIVEPAVAHLGIAADHVVAMTPRVASSGAVLAELDGPVIYGDGKLAGLERLRGDAREAMLGAFGDSAYDAPMLRAARVPVAVTPAPSLVAVASTIPGLLVLER